VPEKAENVAAALEDERTIKK